MTRPLTSGRLAAAGTLSAADYRRGNYRSQGFLQCRKGLPDARCRGHAGRELQVPADSRNPHVRRRLAVHIADHQTRFCSASRGTPRQGDAASKTSKADLVAALAASFAECDAAWGALTDANMNESEGQRSRMGWPPVGRDPQQRGIRVHVALFPAEGAGAAFERSGRQVAAPFVGSRP